MQDVLRSTELIVDGNYCEAVLPLIKSAKKEISLCIYAWRWYEDEPEIGIQKFNSELIRARRRGVFVRALVDTKNIFYAMRKHDLGVRYVESNKIMHVKAVMIDQKHLVLGSHNFTKRAQHDNYELSLIVRDFEVCAQFGVYFDTIYGVASES